MVRSPKGLIVLGLCVLNAWAINRVFEVDFEFDPDVWLILFAILFGLETVSLWGLYHLLFWLLRGL
jgi:hypothetical protein